MASLEDIAQSADPLDRRAASRDLWPRGTLQLWLGQDPPMPDRVFWPEDDAEVARILADAASQGRVVVPYGAGSGVCGGARGRRGAWVLDTKRFDQIGDVDPETWTVECGAGVLGQHLEDHLQARGFTLGHSPSSIWCSTVGGWAAARSAGQFSSRYGVFEDMILGLDLVTPGGGAVCVGVPGPDSPSRRVDDAWMPLILGSEGTLGVVTRVRLRVRPVAEARVLRGYVFDDVVGALDAMRQLMQGELWPSVVRLYDPLDTLIGGRTRPKSDRQTDAWWRDWLKAAEDLPAVRRRSLVLPLALPSLVRGLADALSRGCLLIVGWEGDPEVVEACSSAGLDILGDLGRDLGTDPGERWFASRHDVSYKLMPVFEGGGFADTMEIAATWSALPRVYAAVRDAVSPHAVVLAHMSHVYPEGGSIYFSFAGRGDLDTYDTVWRVAMEAVRREGATTTHHHGVGRLKADAVSREVGPAVVGWRRLKSAVDPSGILNPGRVFVEVPDPRDPPPRRLRTRDGLVAVGQARSFDAVLAACEEEGVEPLWSWEHLDLPRWQRSAWQTTWVEVRGRIGGRDCALGRGPRSASGPDLRPWLVHNGEAVDLTVGAVAEGPRWMGRGQVDRPWQVAQDLLRLDLRPAVLTVRDGTLFVGFRGPAAEALGALADARVPGGLSACAWTPLPHASVDLEPCGIDDPGVVHVTSELAFRRRTR